MVRGYGPRGLPLRGNVPNLQLKGNGVSRHRDSGQEDPTRVDVTLIHKLDALLRAARRRTAGLREAVLAEPAVDRWRLAEAVQELDLAHEELRVAEEALYTQADALAVSQGDLVAECDEYRAIYHEAPIAHLITDELGVIRNANRQACALLGVESTFICSKPLAIYVSAEDRDALRALWTQPRGTSTVARCELHLVPRAKTPRPPIRVSLAFSWLSNTPARSSIILQELAAPQHSSTELDSSSALDPLICIAEQLPAISHELRSPLSGIKGWLSLLAQRSAAPPLRERACAAIQRNIELLSLMLDQLVDNARAREALIELAPRPTALASLVQETIHSHQQQADLLQITLACELPESLPELWIDPQRVRQILFALLRNALCFGAAGDTITVKLTACDDNIVLSVHDDGCGVASEHLDRIFEPFARLPRNGQRSPGLGLGLSIARHLAELHGGTLQAESAGVGRGATFRLSLPFKPEPRVEASESRLQETERAVI
jgi:signal transduction histidine kinase